MIGCPELSLHHYVRRLQDESDQVEVNIRTFVQSCGIIISLVAFYKSIHKSLGARIHTNSRYNSTTYVVS
jgi:hypothetical protein